MTLAFVCDFDGTVTPDDVGARLVERFAPASPDRDAALERWRAGTLGHRELTEIECRDLRLTPADAAAFARDFGVDPEFVPFARRARAEGHVVEIVSEGFGFYIADALERAGMGDLPWSANRLRLEGGRAIPEFPQAAQSCGACGNCKGARVREHQARGRTVVFVGDGYSDRCGARAADRVFARDALRAWCRTHRPDAEPFEGFAALSRRFAGTAEASPTAGGA